MSKIGSQQNIKSEVLIRPRITEKASLLSGGDTPVYVFEIDPRFNKLQVARAIREQYKVFPVKVNIVNTPAKSVLKRGKVGKKSAIKKALVFLKKGDKIDFV